MKFGSYFFILMFSFLGPSYGGISDFFRSSPKYIEKDPVDLKLTFPLGKNFDLKQFPKMHLHVTYTASKSDEKGIKTTESCSSSKIPVWGGRNCIEIPEAIFKSYEIEKVGEEKILKAKVYSRLQGPGDYQAGDVSIKIEENSQALDWNSLFRFKKDALPSFSKIVLFHPNTSHSLLVESLSPTIGFYLSRNFQELPDDKENKRLLKDLAAKSQYDRINAYVSREGMYVIDESPLIGSMMDDCVPTASKDDPIVQVMKQFKPELEDMNLHSDVSKKTNFSEEKNCVKAFYFDLKKNLIHFTLSFSNGYFHFSESITRNSEQEAIKFELSPQGEISFYSHTKERPQRIEILNHWIPGLEKILPRYSHVPNKGDVDRKLSQYKILLDFLKKRH